MRILITGAAGMLGSELAALAGPDALATDKTELDILQADRVRAVLREHHPQWIVDCAAFTRVDDCEGNPDAFRLNAEGPEVLARSCREADAKLLHISTDYVFDGEKGSPYTEDDEPNPLNDYGRGKLEGERRAMEAHPEGVTIVRTAWMFGANGPCFPKTILNAARQARPLRVVADQTGSPTFASDLARAILLLLHLGPPPGVFHIANSGTATWHQVALATLEAAGIEAEVEAIRTEDWPTRARRPRYSVLDCSKAHRLGLPPLRPWRDALTEFVQSLLHASP